MATANDEKSGSKSCCIKALKIMCWCLAGVLLPGVFLLGIYFEVHSQLMEYLKVLLSWPVVVLTGLILVIFTFKSQISFWLTRMKIEWGGAVISGGQAVIEDKPIEALPQTQSNPKSESPDFNSMSKEELAALADQWRINAYLWEYGI